MRILITCLLLLSLTAIIGCADNRTVDTERNLLKVLAYEKVYESTQTYLNVTFDPHESQIMGHDEILQFLREADVPISTLPESLQQALRERQVVGLLVSRFSPIRQDSSIPVPKKLNEIQRMLLSWEMSLERGGYGDGSHYGTGVMWVEANDDENEKCDPMDKCENYFLCDSRDSCPKKGIFCIGLIECPPCRKCECCDSGPPIS